MKKRIVWMLGLLCTVAQGAWAQTWKEVTKATLVNNITNNAYIKLTEDIQLDNYLNIEGMAVTIDLNGHKLSRNLSSSSDAGHIFWIHNNGHLTIADNSSTHSGSIEGGNATNGGGINVWPGCTLNVSYVTFKNNSASDNGGAIFIRNGATATISNATFIGNFAADHAGAIWNNGTLSATDCTFENNTASDVGGIYNSVTVTDGTTYAGTATLSGCSFTGNVGTAGAGALANAQGNTEMIISGCTITGNTAGSNGGGIWNGGTLKMQGTVTVTDNHRNGDVASNVYLKDEKVITLTGALTENSSIGVELENATGTFTSGYKDIHYQKDPNTFFTADLSVALSVVFDSNHEAYLTIINGNDEYYVERSWDTTNEKMVSTYKFLKGILRHDETPVEGTYKEVTSAPASDPDEWFQMGGFNDNNNNIAEFYVVRGNVNRETIVVQGKDVHLVLADNATLTLTGGLKLEDDNKLYIHCQSYGDKMGRLMVTNEYENAAGIGSAVDEEGNENTVGELVIHGGHIEVTGGKYAAGIGSCRRTKDENFELCKSITVYGGYVKATGGIEGAGIGVGSYYNGFHSAGGDFYLYDGTVLAVGGERASGVGGGASCHGINVTVYGGSLTALGDEDGAGIGSGSNYHNEAQNRKLSGGKCTIFGGTVTAIGGKRAAGIGGGKLCGGAEVNISGGRVMASGGRDGAGIGGGLHGFGGVVTISGGTVSATGGEGASGIGGGYEGQGGDVNITGGTVIAQTTDGAYGPGSAIGEGADSYKGMGELYIGDAMMVGAGNNGSVESILDAAERVDGCWFQYYAEISPCTHPSGITYTINEGGTHTSHCKHCGLAETEKHSNGDGTGTCICGYKVEGYCTITLATSSKGTSYEGFGITVYVGNNMPYTLPVCSSIPEGYDFAGWVVAPTSQDNGILPNVGETLLQAGDNITVTGSVSIFARYRALEISLADNSDNAETLYNYNGKKDASVTLKGRKLWKDGYWNTLCLPFSLTTTEQLSQLGYSALMELDTDNNTTYEHITGFENGTLYLNFKDAESIEAGKPYIVKWSATTPDYSEDPVFTGVTINNALIPVESADGSIAFVGTYSPYSIAENNNTLLYVGANNTLYYPQPALTNPNAEYNAETNPYVPVTIGSCRAFFHLYGITAGTPSSPGIRAFVLNFGDDSEQTGIMSASKESGSQGVNEGWFLLDGRKLSSKPTTPGLYIHGAKKVYVKP